VAATVHNGSSTAAAGSGAWGEHVQEPSAPDAAQRQLKTLVLTDLCDSVALVERVGDAAAADLFRTLDARVLGLLQQWNGRLIDRSDGMLLLFEAPTQGLGFALAYLEELERLGLEQRLPLRARVGIHVGYVLAWQNSEAAVTAGAKPLEVEGVAKPTAARLMALARPNQILVSAVAESLLRGGQHELGERGAQLQWKSHGRWYFKGLPTVQEVFEVGVPGRAPLRMPVRSSKAWRALPLWRRPAALIAEMALLAGLVVLTWVLVRPEPAIAFGERDWVVVGGFTNATEDPRLSDALREALRMSLEQSRYVNVLSDLKTRETLQQMRRDPTQMMDRATAIELTVREGARALILPSVREVNGKLRVTLDVIDPASGKTVYSEHVDGNGLESSLVSTDKVANRLRRHLGEALAEITSHSAPLPRVATSSLDALHAYSVGLNAYADNRRDDALGHFEQAARLDPDFAAAYMGQMRVASSKGDFARARDLLAQAASHRANLSARDQLYLDSWNAELSGAGAVEAAHRWKLLGDLYPDFHTAHHNRSGALFSLGRYAEAEREVRLALVPQNPMRTVSLRHLARLELAQNKNQQALTSFQQASAMGGPPDRELAAAMAAVDDFDGAWRVLAAIPESSTPAWLERIAVAVDQGNLAAAREHARKARLLCELGDSVCSTFDLQSLALRLLSDAAPAAAEFERWLILFHRNATSGQAGDAGDWAFMAAATLYLAQRSEHDALVAAWLPRMMAMATQVDERRARQLVGLVQAGAEADPARLSGMIGQLQGQVDGTELIQLHVQLQALHARNGNVAAAGHEHGWVAAQRGLAYTENAGTYALLALNVADVRRARLERAQ